MNEIEVILSLENIFTNFSNKLNLQEKLHDIFVNTNDDFNTKMYCFITEILMNTQTNIENEHPFLMNLETKYGLPVVTWVGSRSIKEFSLIFFESGIFVSIVSDAIDMSKEERNKKWKQELKKWNQDRQYQLETWKKQQIYLEKMRNCRKQNEIAYNLLKKDFNSLLEKKQEWSQVITSSVDELKNWNKISWICVRIDNLHPLQRRAVVYKIEQFEKIHGTTHLPNNMRYRCMHANWSLLDENDVTEHTFSEAEQELKRCQQNEKLFLNGRRKSIDKVKDAAITPQISEETISQVNAEEINFYHDRIIEKHEIDRIIEQHEISKRKNKNKIFFIIYNLFSKKLKRRRLTCQISSIDLIQH